MRYEVENVESLETLTAENAKQALNVVRKSHPEWGAKRFRYEAQDLTEGRKAHVVGTGFDSSVMGKSKMHLWAIVHYK